jgi:hypothetical protein
VSTIDENVALTKPVIEWEINTVNKRPELQLFDLQSEQIEISKTQFQKVIYPKSMLLQAGYGNGLNMLDNSFQTFTCSVQRRTGMCLIGINLKKKKRHYSFLRHRNYRKETFLLNTNLQLKEMERNH